MAMIDILEERYRAGTREKTPTGAAARGNP